jgi:hypothetical protein
MSYNDIEDKLRQAEIAYKLSNMKVKPWEEGQTIARFEWKDVGRRILESENKVNCLARD